MNIKWKRIGIKQLSAIISNYLQANGINVILVGGACVSIYSDNKYMSLDIDLVTTVPIRKITPLLKELGFNNISGRLFENPECKFLLDFPAPPVSIGNEPVFKFRNLKTRFGNICLLTPTDCVKDRLCAYFFWNDLQALEQAVIVAKNNKVNFSEIKKWAKKQREKEKYEIFRRKCR